MRHGRAAQGGGGSLFGEWLVWTILGVVAGVLLGDIASAAVGIAVAVLIGDRLAVDARDLSIGLAIAVAQGCVTGTVLGVVQERFLTSRLARLRRWTVATVVGLVVANTLVVALGRLDFLAEAPALLMRLLQSIATGGALGVSQGLVLRAYGLLSRWTAAVAAAFTVWTLVHLAAAPAWSAASGLLGWLALPLVRSLLLGVLLGAATGLALSRARNRA